jgi:hypothetical protein
VGGPAAGAGIQRLRPLGAVRLDRFGDRRHGLTVADSRKGGVAHWAAHREREARLEHEGAEMLAEELLASIRVWIEVRDDLEAPPSVRLAAADRTIERLREPPSGPSAPSSGGG